MPKAAIAQMTSPNGSAKRGRPVGGPFGAPKQVELIDEPDDLVFSERAGGRTSYYLLRLKELEYRGGVAVFEESKSAITQLRKSARKLGYKILFAMKDGKVYAKLGDSIEAEE